VVKKSRVRRELLKKMAKLYKKNHVKHYFLQIKKATFDQRVTKRGSSIGCNLNPNGSMIELKDKVRGMDRALELMYNDKASKDELDSIRNHLSQQ